MVNIIDLIIPAFISLIFVVLVLIAIFPNLLPKIGAKLLRKEFRDIGSGYESVEKQSRTDDQSNKQKELFMGVFRD